MSKSIRKTRGVAWQVIALAAFVFVLFTPPALAREENGKTFEAPGATIYYEAIGTGEPIVVVNGGPGFDHTYIRIATAWDALGKNHQVVFYDQRGNGRSVGDHKGQSQTLKDQIDDLEALRAHLGIERLDLLGHSWGGYLVMAYAAVHPDRVAHLIIVDSAAPKIKDTRFLFDDVFPEVTERQASFAFADELGDKAATAASLREYWTMLCYSPEKGQALAARIPPTVLNKDVNKAVFADLDRYDLNPEIRKFKFPTLVITGRYDINVAPVVAYKIHQGIPGSKFLVFERSGHFPFYEEPEAFVKAVEEFLAGK